MIVTFLIGNDTLSPNFVSCYLMILNCYIIFINIIIFIIIIREHRRRWYASIATFFPFRCRIYAIFHIRNNNNIYLLHMFNIREIHFTRNRMITNYFHVHLHANLCSMMATYEKKKKSNFRFFSSNVGAMWKLFSDSLRIPKFWEWISRQKCLVFGCFFL